MTDRKTEHTYCLNCNTPFNEGILEDEEFYCPNCGQSNLDSRLSFGKLIKDAVSNILNLDSRLIHTFRDLIYPSKLTRTYIEGKRKYYVNPARLFIFTLLALITLSIYSIKIDNSSMGVDDSYAKAERSKVMEEYKALIDTMDVAGHEEILDSVQSKLFAKVRKLEEDTLGVRGLQLFSLGRSTESFGISRYDGLHLTQNELFEKYNITNFWDKINVGQYIRITTNPVGGIKHIVKNLTWAVFVTVLFISFFMKLLYIRKQYYLVEHAVLVLNSHSLLFVLLALFYILNLAIDIEHSFENYEPLIIISSITFLYILQYRTLKKYYNQGFFKTAIKQIIINSAYFIIFVISIIVVALISLILY